MDPREQPLLRRDALKLGLAAAASWAGCGSAGSVARNAEERGAEPVVGTAPRGGTAPPEGDELDEALTLVHRAEPRIPQGLSTHAPMAAETLCALGFADHAVDWVARYQRPVIAIPEPRARIEPAAWRAALGPRPGAATWEGALERWGDWRLFFEDELCEARWQDVLDRWTARLAPGLGAAATHGVIRTAHAARALARRETPVRRAELARGLAYWAAAYEELPARAPRASDGAERPASFERALERVPLYQVERGPLPPGDIVSGLRRVGELERFADVLALAEPPADVDAALSALSATFARVFLRHGTRHDAIAFVHAVTGPCALRKLAPHVRPETARDAFPYAWQTAAAIYAVYARPDDDGPLHEPSRAPDELALRALENGDEHALKFTEVLLAEHARSPDPAYLAAAEEAVARL